VSEERYPLAVRRILVALDASPHSIAALEAAVELAARFRAELLGLFVEDINLLRLAKMPFARELGLFSASRRPLDTQEVERQLRAQTARIRKLLATLGERAQISWSFRVARGRIVSEVLTAAAEADLVLLGKTGWPVAHPRRLGSTIRAVLSAAPGPLLVFQHGARLKPPILVLYDGSPAADRALVAAATLMAQEDSQLIVLALSNQPAEAERLQARATAQLQGRKLQVRYCALAGSSLPQLLRKVRAERCGTLILPAPSPLLRQDTLVRLLEEIEQPVVLIR